MIWSDTPSPGDLTREWCCERLQRVFSPHAAAPPPARGDAPLTGVSLADSAATEPLGRLGRRPCVTAGRDRRQRCAAPPTAAINTRRDAGCRGIAAGPLGAPRPVGSDAGRRGSSRTDAAGVGRGGGADAARRRCLAIVNRSSPGPRCWPPVRSRRSIPDCGATLPDGRMGGGGRPWGWDLLGGSLM